ncbi:hypothetical protein EYF80_003985 [Liparis tanakae]|uniref:Uncharacterized protein n=1 Tax=Liparis tanakae TaxID=230148 RepID=A0A4Z2J7R6_9TELE|nr:hypothetical protein EYF80_003985 [Liparis tanakae]
MKAATDGSPRPFPLLQRLRCALKPRWTQIHRHREGSPRLVCMKQVYRMVSSETLSQAVHKRTADVDPHQSHLRNRGERVSVQSKEEHSQAGFVLLHVRGAVRVIEVVNEVLADLQPTGNIFLHYLLVEIVHVVMILHWALSAVWPATEAGRRQETVVSEPE